MTGLDISTILPELLLAIYALAALLAGAYLGKDRIARQILWASVAALLAAAMVMGMADRPQQSAFFGMFMDDAFGRFAKVTILPARNALGTTEQLPLEVLPRLARLDVGQVMRVPAPQGFLVVQVAAADKQPLDEKQAQPFIEQFLVNQKRLALAQSEVRSLRGEAKIEYVGDFAAPGTAAGAEGRGSLDKGILPPPQIGTMPRGLVALRT